MRTPQAVALALTLASACSGLKAEEPGLTIGFKLRGDLQVSHLQDGLGSKVLAMGLEASLPFGPGKLYGELGYQFKTGQQALADLGTMDRATSSTVINPAFSINSEKNKLEGMLLRLGYGAALATTWEWKAGLQLGGAKFTNQAIGFVTDGTIDAGGNLNNASYLDTFATTNSKTTLAISPFAGVVHHLDAYSSLEFGLLLLNYKTFLYNHVAGTEATNPANPDPAYVWGGHDAQDTYVQKNRLTPHFEVAYVFHF